MPKEICRWKGRIVKECVYQKHLQAINLGKEKKSKSDLPMCEGVQKSEIIEQPENSISFEDRRIVELQFLGSQLWCCFWKETLSLQFIENELIRSCGSLITIRCHKCLILNKVSTGKQHGDEKRSNTHRFDVNSKIVMGTYFKIHI